MGKILHFCSIFLEIVQNFKVFFILLKKISWADTESEIQLNGLNYVKMKKIGSYCGKYVSIPMNNETIYINEDLKIYEEVDNTLSDLVLYLFYFRSVYLRIMSLWSPVDPGLIAGPVLLT